MISIRLPGTDLTVSALAYGTGDLGTRARGDAADRLVDQYLAAGGTFFDTAHVYAAWLPDGLGASERELGRILQRVGRDRVAICTKGGHPGFGPHYQRPERYFDPPLVAADLSESLERLRTDWVDIYLLHRDDPRVPADEVIDLLSRFVEAGRVRFVGCSNWPTARIEAANAYAARAGLPRLSVVQNQWSLAVPNWSAGPDPITRLVTPADAGWCAAHEVSVMAYSPTGCGWFGEAGERARPFDNNTSRARRERAEQLGRELGRTANQVALAWLAAQPGTVIPVLGSCNERHLADALAAAELELSPEQAAWLSTG